MNFTEAFKELDIINEEVLTEKHWVTIQPNYTQAQKEDNKPEYFYKFLTVNDSNKRSADIIAMLNKHTGTYKQMLDQDVFAELVQTLKEIDPDDYSNPKNYTVLDYKPPEEGKKEDKTKFKTLTLADRFLRQQAQNKLNDIIADSSKLQTVFESKKCLIHHINGHEDETKPENVVLVPYDPGDKDSLKIANGIHSVLHTTANKQGIKKELVEWNTPLYWFDEAQGQWQTGSCKIVIKLSP